LNEEVDWYAMDEERVREIEARIADLERRWPRHSAPPALYAELEELESELEEARGAGDGDGDGRTASTG
jgi:hypothetical protein